MKLNEKLTELNFNERKLELNKDYTKEYFTFNREAAITALCFLIDNATSLVEIFHKPISNKFDNQIIESLRNNKKIKIKYYTNITSKKDTTMIEECLGNRVEIIDLNLGENKIYHHKEMVIDNKFTIITTLNFMTNTIFEDINHKNFYLENFSIWIKRRER